MSTYTDYAILATGITSVLTGSIVLIVPANEMPVCPDTVPYIRDKAVASITTGVYHIIAYHQANEGFYKASIFMRLFFTLISWIQQREGIWWVVSMYNLFGAVITAILLAVEEESPYPIEDSDCECDSDCDCEYDSDDIWGETSDYTSNDNLIESSDSD